MERFFQPEHCPDNVLYIFLFIIGRDNNNAVCHTATYIGLDAVYGEQK
ncbi:hypothetical protein Barb7_03203 [Bacteroidales bacterium Barb7]|nr:hypothetical protein Barb7_03203 [Bacteroidales bacterium Barb7]